MTTHELFLSEIAQFHQNFEAWVQGQMAETEQRFRQHYEIEKDAHTKVKQMQIQKNKLLQQIDQNRREDERRRAELEALAKAVDKLREYDSMYPAKLNLHIKESKREEQVLLNKKEELRRKEREKQERMAELTEGLAMYEQFLSVTFERNHGPGGVRMVFTNVDPNDTSREFFFTIRVDDDYVYRIEDCQPPIKDVDQLVEELNRTQNLMRLAAQMRRRFVEYATNRGE